MDKLLLKRLETDCIIGIFKRERVRRQKVWIDLEIPCDAPKAARTDSIRDAVDYKRIAKRILKLTGRSRFFLIETLAERIADVLLREFRLTEIGVTVSKPGAVRFSQNVCVSITRKSSRSPNSRDKTAFLSIGSNVAPRQNIARAIAMLRKEFGELKTSSVYESSAVGSTGGLFWNCVVRIQAPGTPQRLKVKLLGIEKRLKRRRRPGEKFAPRPIDLDIVYFGSRVLKKPGLEIPHPDSEIAPYVLLPMAEIQPEFVHPSRGRTMIELLGGRLDAEGLFRTVSL